MATVRIRSVTTERSASGCPTCSAEIGPEQAFCHLCGSELLERPPVPVRRATSRQGGNVQPVQRLPAHPLAILSLALGLVAWGPLPVGGAIAAVYVGHLARRRIAESPEQVGGQGLIRAGLVLGYFQLICLALAFLAVLAVLGFGIFVSWLR